MAFYLLGHFGCQSTMGGSWSIVFWERVSFFRNSQLRTDTLSKIFKISSEKIKTPSLIFLVKLSQVVTNPTRLQKHAGLPLSRHTAPKSALQTGKLLTILWYSFGPYPFWIGRSYGTLSLSCHRLFSYRLESREELPPRPSPSERSVRLSPHYAPG